MECWSKMCKSHWSVKYWSKSPGQGTCKVSTSRRKTMQDMVVVGLIVEELSIINVKCQGYHVTRPRKVLEPPLPAWGCLVGLGRSVWESCFFLGTCGILNWEDWDWEEPGFWETESAISFCWWVSELAFWISEILPPKSEFTEKGIDLRLSLEDSVRILDPDIANSLLASISSTAIRNDKLVECLRQMTNACTNLRSILVSMSSDCIVLKAEVANRSAYELMEMTFLAWRSIDSRNLDETLIDPVVDKSSFDASLSTLGILDGNCSLWSL